MDKGGPVVSREAARDELQKLNLPPLVEALFDGTAVTHTLAYRCQEPYYAFQDGSILPANFVPLWECGTTITGYDPADSRFKIINLECPEEPFDVFERFEFIVADLMISLWEDEVPECDLRATAKQFEFDNINIIIRELLNQDWEDYDMWRSEMILGLPNSNQ